MQGRFVQQVAGSCALLDDWSVKCWGSSSMAFEDNKLRGDQPNEMGNKLPTIKLGTVRKCMQTIYDSKFPFHTT
jgi:hypothetical protein